MEQRFSPPTSQVEAPYKTIMKVQEGEDASCNYYIQIARAEEKPQWIRVGMFLEKAFENFIDNKEFIDECLRLFEPKKEVPFANISKIIKE